MKTPREILLEQHRNVTPRLEAMEPVIRAALKPAPTRVRQPGFLLLQLWQELVAPCRAVWLGLATLWLVILGLNVASGNSANRASSDFIAPGPETRARLLEQRQLWVEVAGLTPEPETVRRSAPPRPRSERGGDCRFARVTCHVSRVTWQLDT